MSGKKKILHVVEALGGGVFSYIVELSNGLSQEFDVTIAFGTRDETPENYAEYFNYNIQLIQVKAFCRRVNPIKDIKACFELSKIIKKVSPDIIHLHSSKAGAVGRMIRKPRNAKLFYTPHGYSFLMGNTRKVKKMAYWCIEKIYGRKDCMTIACGKGEWKESNRVTKRATYVNNGINLDTIHEILSKTEISEHPFTVYTLGRISYQKNPEMFNEIAKRMKNVHFLWIGDGDQRNRLTAPNVEVTGWVSREEALSRAAWGDVFILPSRWEGLPISLLEAMYMRKACVVSNVPGNIDVVNDKENGYICNTVEEFVDAIQKIREDSSSDITENAYNEIFTEYNSSQVCKKYKEIYLEK